MPYKDPEQARMAQRERSRRYRAKKHVERYGANVGPQNGRHGNHATGCRNGRWNKARLLSSHGYVLVRVGKHHPLAFGSGYAYEHDLVMVEYLGRALRSGEVVHHRNGDRTDNRIENLDLTTASEHQRHHANETRNRDGIGRFA